MEGKERKVFSLLGQRIPNPGPIKNLFRPWHGPVYTQGEKGNMFVTPLFPFAPVPRPTGCCFGAARAEEDG